MLCKYFLMKGAAARIVSSCGESPVALNIAWPNRVSMAFDVKITTAVLSFDATFDAWQRKECDQETIAACSPFTQLPIAGVLMHVQRMAQHAMSVSNVVTVGF